MELKRNGRKSVDVEIEVWKRLQDMKLKQELKTLNDVIKNLLGGKNEIRKTNRNAL